MHGYFISLKLGVHINRKFSSFYCVPVQMTPDVYTHSYRFVHYTLTMHLNQKSKQICFHLFTSFWIPISYFSFCCTSFLQQIYYMVVLLDMRNFEKNWNVVFTFLQLYAFFIFHIRHAFSWVYGMDDYVMVSSFKKFYWRERKQENDGWKGRGYGSIWRNVSRTLPVCSSFPSTFSYSLWRIDVSLLSRSI